MIDTDEVEGVRIEQTNFTVITARCLRITDFLANIGFDMYAAIDGVLQGRFSSYLKTMLKENSSSFPEKLPLDCYSKLVGHWLDCFIRNVTPTRFPASALVRKALKLRLCVLIKTSDLLPAEVCT